MTLRGTMTLIAGLAFLSAGCTSEFRAAGSSNSLGDSSAYRSGVNSIQIKAVSSSNYQNFALPSLASSFVLDFDAIPSANAINATTSLGQGAASASAPGAIVVRFNPSGGIDVLSAGAYKADASVSYSAGQAYHFRIDVNFAAKSFNVLVTPDGGLEQIVAQNYPFSGSVSAFSDFAVQASSGSHQVFDVNITIPVATQTPSVNPTPAPTATPKPTATPAPTATPSPIAASTFTVTSPAQGATVSGIVAVSGQAGSNWVNVAAFDLGNNYNKVSDDITPVNGMYTIHVDTSKIAAGSANIAVMGFSTPAGQSGGTATSVTLNLNVMASANPTPVPSATPKATPVPTPAPTPVAGNIIWADEFDSFSLYNSVTNSGNWAGTSINGTDGGVGWGAEYDISPKNTSLGVNPFSVSGGYLTITTDRAPSSLQSKINGYQYTSGAIRTVNPSFGYAYYEMRAQLPKGSGMWPAFWLLPADGAWPPEIDIVEGLGNSPDVDYTTVHSTTNFANSTNVGTGHWQYSGGENVGVDTQSGFHTYGVDFRADYITWYFDGKQVFKSITPSDLVNRKVYIILDTAVGGWNGNSVTSSTPFPANYVIDYVRVYSALP